MQMSYEEGGNLHQKLCDGDFVENRIQYIASQLVEALCWLHSRTPPIVHRDIKPENIYITDRDQVKLLDFGTVRSMKIGTGATPRHDAPTSVSSSVGYSGGAAAHAWSDDAGSSGGASGASVTRQKTLTNIGTE